MDKKQPAETKDTERSIVDFSTFITKRIKEQRLLLISPYTDKDLEVMAHRYRQVLSVTALLIREGFNAFSSIVHCHPISLAYSLPGDYGYWQSYCESFLSNWAEAVVVLVMPGTFESVGVKAEIEMAEKLKLPVYYILR